MKRLIMSLILTSLLLVSACESGGDYMINSDGKTEDILLKQVLDAISSKDSASLEMLFSVQAQNDAADLPGDIDYLFGFFQGTVISWENIGNSGSVSKEGENRIESKKYFYVVTTDIDQYLFFFLEYTQDTVNSENIGLYMMQVVRYEDADSSCDAGQDILCAGIYHPQE